MSKVYLISGPGQGRTFDIDKEVTSIGKTADNDIQIPHDSISRKHARIIRRENQFFVEDLKSQNGTRVDDQPVIPGHQVEVKDGSLISIADILLSLGAPYSVGGMVTRYSISLTEQEEGRSFYRDRRITKRKNLQIIYELSTTLMQSLDVHEICNHMMDALFRSLPRIDSGAILLVDRDEGGGVNQILARVRDPKRVKKGKYSRPIVNRVIHEGKAVMMSDTGLEANHDLSESMDTVRMKSIMCVPLIAESRILGAVYVHSVGVSHAFRKDDLLLFTALSTPAALAVENALLYAERKEAENELRRAHGELEKKIQERTQDYSKANQLLMEEVQERRRTEEELRETNRFLKSILDSSSLISIMSTDIDQNILFWNKGAENIFGYKAEEMIGRRKVDVLYGDDETKRETDRIRTLILKEKKDVTAEIQEVGKDGRKLWFRLNLTPRFDDKGDVVGILGVGEDITQRKQLERDFLQAQKMEAIGTLAGGIAHDFNNLLMGIQGNASLMLLDIDSSHPHHERLRNIEQYLRSGAELTKQLLGFARGGKYEVKAIDLNELIEKSSQMFGRTKKEIRIHGKYQGDIWPVEVDRGQIEQVMLNLYVNAWQAMPGGGELYLQTENLHFDEEDAHLYQLNPGRYVRISVTDTGVGMDKKTQERIFEPFFTTKELGRGTGLGLASAYGIIRNHDGVIKVHSEKGIGTTFQVHLPASEKAVVEEQQWFEGVFTGSETILLVDDEEMIIDVGKGMMEKLGYKILIARSGKEAIETYEENQDRIDIVILDMIMPQMGGGETYDQLKRINPGIKVLLSSGYSIDGRAKEILDCGCDGFIQKPFNIRNLSQKIREILDRS